MSYPGDSAGARRIEVVEYDRAWPVRFEEEARPLREVFAAVLVDIYHVGSTSVPGLAAKPTIDILVEVAPGTGIPSFDPAMEALGYVCRGECLDAEIPGTPGRYYYVRKEGTVHITHVHVCASGHGDIREQLAFRDFLCGHPQIAAEYGQLKRMLSGRFAFDNIGYMRGKDEFVKRAITMALADRAAEEGGA